MLSPERSCEIRGLANKLMDQTARAMIECFNAKLLSLNVSCLQQVPESPVCDDGDGERMRK
ncbi:hypothetical protein PENTCL1PPCAC_6754 [Pristionchus entomophagus]|uniref:Uncharacterized protein n=1 Tax=Pristionchus entomophagus TaxID=358040 RepID=A0AAV5SWF5_9BILA|nr:hypothetical protein PENTCL1PPCAC_6754 [Pristionchus entomophagus]